MSDYYNIIDTAVEAAEKRGMEKGKLEAAKKMLAAGFDAKAVADALGISVESILV